MNEDFIESNQFILFGSELFVQCCKHQDYTNINERICFAKFFSKFNSGKFISDYFIFSKESKGCVFSKHSMLTKESSLFPTEYNCFKCVFVTWQHDIRFLYFPI